MGRADDDEGVTRPQVAPDPAFGLLELYDDALPHVCGYLLARCGDTLRYLDGLPVPEVARHLDRAVLPRR